MLVYHFSFILFFLLGFKTVTILILVGSCCQLNETQCLEKHRNSFGFVYCFVLKNCSFMLTIKLRNVKSPGNINWIADCFLLMECQIIVCICLCFVTDA